MGLVRRRLPNGLEVTQVDPGEAALIYREIFVEESYLRDGFPSTVPEVIFDVGANIGLASIFFKQRFPDAFVVAAEPGPGTYAALRENFARHVPSGVAREVAVSDRDGVRRFGYYPQAPAESGFYADQRQETELARRLLVGSGVPGPAADRLARERHRLSYVDCRTVTLSTLIREQGVDRVDLLKIDVEKGELDVLAGIEEPDWARIGHLVLEVHDIAGRLARVVSMLRGRGFRVDSCQEDRLSGTGMHLLHATAERRPAALPSGGTSGRAGRTPSGAPGAGGPA
ncbi:FkbM family methyltransferase [Planomonospora sp. ID91781]|uniref:Methyltransferase n=1 Tax=Planomonospora sphaerica TaxID=161355 RepID=A0A171CRM8_9ACTN|nr:MULTISPECIES: FkbM family methyltransferase [Planomonospora]MBG0823417.1 FkbM family methyltransferase [Planomonospora sp. ID91781]GAT67111.1 methyltransferase [Planomonospora sphaerica]